MALPRAIRIYTPDGWQDVAVQGPPGSIGPTGATGSAGAAGATGSTGATGPGVAVGGTTDQLLAKNSATNYDTKWVAAPSGGSAGHTIQDEGVALTARTGLNFVGAGVTATDDSANNRTVVTIPNTGTASAQTFTYVSDGDTNGVIYWLGSKGGTFGAPVANTAAAVAEGYELRLDSLGIYNSSFPLVFCVDRTAGTPAATSDVAGSYIRFDFRYRRLRPTRYSLRTRGDSDAGHPRSWVLEGSNDGSAWTTLDTRTNDTQLTGLNKWVTYTCTATGNYEFLRIRQTAANSAALNYLTVGEIEFYGDLVDVTGSVTDTGWVTVTGPSYDTSASNPNPYQYRRIGNEMYIRGNLRTTIALGDGNSIAGVPAGGGPGYPGIINVLVNGVKETLDITTTGAIAIIGSGYTAATTRIWKLPFISWRVD